MGYREDQEAQGGTEGLFLLVCESFGRNRMQDLPVLFSHSIT